MICDVIDFGSAKFHEIPQQDNPAFDNAECVMVVANSKFNGHYDVLAIIPNPDDSVNTIAVFYNHECAMVFANNNEKWFDKVKEAGV